MSTRRPPRRNTKNNRRRRSGAGRQRAIDIWHVPDPPPPAAPIVAADDPTALVRSLGAPPSLGGKDIGYYFETVVAQSSQVATALALSVELLAVHDD